MLNKETPNDLSAWFDTALGQFVLDREYAYFDQTVADIFGFNALQLGLVQHDFLRANRIPFRCYVGVNATAHLQANYTELPIASNSIDLVILPHVVEFSAHPHQILREVSRILMPEGSIVISGFNPWSLWGLRRRLDSNKEQAPWCGNFINLPRLKDWLSLLEFEVVGGKMGCYTPPFMHETWRRRFEFMEPSGDRWWPIAGGVYFLQAIKRVHGMRVIIPTWSEVPKKKVLAPAPTPIPRKKFEHSMAGIEE